MRVIDLNCDLGEGGEADADLMSVISSASIACGAHAGDTPTMRRTLRLARWAGVAAGAHPGLADRAGFGRTEAAITPDEVERLVRSQVGALAALAAGEGVRLRHVKPHGALYARAARDAAIAAAIARAVRSVDPALALFGPPGSRILEAAAALGLAAAAEGFADRAYEPDGSLTPRSRAGALVEQPPLAAARALRMAAAGRVVSSDGTDLELRVETICVHGDTPGAAAVAGAVRQALEAAGLTVAPLFGGGGRVG